MKSFALLLTTSCAIFAASVVGATAGQHYGAHYYDPENDPYVEPVAPPAGFVFMRHSARCEYPHGWSSTDFYRNINGVPRGGEELLATGCGSYEPLSD